MDNSNLISDEEAKMLLNDKVESEVDGDDELALDVSEVNRIIYKGYLTLS